MSRPMRTSFLLAALLVWLRRSCAVSCSSRVAPVSRDVQFCSIQQKPLRKLAFMSIRGGSEESEEYDEEYDEQNEENEEEYDEEYEEEYDGEEEEETTPRKNCSNDSTPAPSDKTTGIALEMTKRSLNFIGKVALSAVNATQRALRAAFYPDEDEIDEEEDASLITRATNTLTRMIKAIFSPPKITADNDINVTKKQKKTKRTAANTEDDEPEEADSFLNDDFGSTLSKTYGVQDNRVSLDAKFTGGSFMTALETAQSLGRLLVVYVPLSKKASKKASDPDRMIIEGLLNEETEKIANKKSRKTKNKAKTPESKLGSFMFWGATPGSYEAKRVIKMIKAKEKDRKGQKSPILAVIHPAAAFSTKQRKIVTTPRLLVQHHCSPPPSSSSMSRWLDSLRKRHAKQYHAMHHYLEEARIAKERDEGFAKSIVDDTQREKREAQEEAERVAKEAKERAEREAMEARRAELLKSLPEPYEGSDAKNIALRFADGRATQRKFSPDESISTIFNWVDAEFEMERETVNLTTMNGRMSFDWDGEDANKTLDDAGLGKMTGFRVLKKKAEEPADQDEDDDE